MKLLYCEYKDGTHDFFDLSDNSSTLLKILVESDDVSVLALGTTKTRDFKTKSSVCFNVKKFLKGDFA